MHKFLLILSLFASLGASAQFNQRLTNAAKELTADSAAMSIKTNTKTDFNFTLYSDAYDKYVRREIFKQRNKLKVRSGLNVTQVSYDNWSSGGNNNFSARAYADLEHNYDDGKFSVKSTLGTAFTMTMSEADKKLQKSEDYLNITTTPSWKIGKHFQFSGNATLRTQWANSFRQDSILISSFMAPGNLNLSLGITYKPSSNLEIYLSPVAGSFQMVLNKKLADKGGLGLDRGQQFKAQLGMTGRIKYNTPIYKDRITYETTIQSNWQYSLVIPDLWWENKVNFKFTRLFGANFYMLVKYNDQLSTPRASENNYWQLNESFGLGLTYNVDPKSHKGPVKTSVTKARNKKARR